MFNIPFKSGGVQPFEATVDLSGKNAISTVNALPNTALLVADLVLTSLFFKAMDGYLTFFNSTTAHSWEIIIDGEIYLEKLTGQNGTSSIDVVNPMSQSVGDNGILIPTAVPIKKSLEIRAKTTNASFGTEFINFNYFEVE